MSPDRVACERFLFEEARLLDEARFEAWLALFADDGFYWIPSHREQSDPYGHISILHEDPTVLRLRVARLAHPRAYAAAPLPRTSRIVGNVMVEPPLDASHHLVVRSTQHVAEYRGGDHHLRASLNTHHLRQTDGGWRIVLKRVDLIDAASPPGLLTVPL